jgi:hypothetical protein
VHDSAVPGILFVFSNGSIRGYRTKEVEMTSEVKGGTTVTLTEEERAELLRLLKHTLGETRAEAHHTHTPAFRDGVLRQEALLTELIAKFQ